MNHLLLSQYRSQWKDKTIKELMELQDVLTDKINSVKGSSSVQKSLEEILFLLEEYMQERGIFENTKKR